MAGVKTVFSATRNKPVIVKYCCSQCGQQNKLVHYISAEGRTAKSGYVRSNDSRADELINNATYLANKNLDANVEWLFKNLSEKNYAETGLFLSCSHCGHKEPWSQINSPFLASIGKALIYTGAAAFIWLIAAIATYSSYIIPSIILSIVVLCFIIRAILLSKYKSAIDRLDPVSLPTAELKPQSNIHIATSKAKKPSATDEVYLSMADKMEQEMAGSTQRKMCPNCNTIMPSSQRYCPSCKADTFLLACKNMEIPKTTTIEGNKRPQPSNQTESDTTVSTPVANAQNTQSVEDSKAQVSARNDDELDIQPMVLFCKRCGKKLLPNSKYCSYCGTEQ